MELYTLEVSVHGQKLELLHDIDIFSGDQNVDYVHFTFQENSEWFEMNTIFAVFSRYGGTSYKVPVSVETGYAANIPAEVMQKKGYIYIGLFGEQGDNILTSSVLQFQLGEGAVSKDTLTPTNDIYEQFIEDLNAYRQAVSDLEGIQADIVDVQGDIADLQTDVGNLEDRAEQIETDLTNSEDTFNGYIRHAAEQAGLSEHYANLSAQSAGQSGYLSFEIDENGHLMMEKINSPVTFELQNGHLIMEEA